MSNQTKINFRLRGNVATKGTLEARACANGDIAIFDTSSNIINCPCLGEHEINVANKELNRKTYLPFLYTETEPLPNQQHTSMITGAGFSVDGSVVATSYEYMKYMFWGVSY